MASRQIQSVLAALEVLLRNDEGRTDGELLRDFLRKKTEAEFAAIVRRHGPMIAGVCRRILGNAADADDAFQATFLVLATKASSLAHRTTLGDWLHGVARRTALHARRSAARRREMEKRSVRPSGSADEAVADMLPILDEELARLPEKYRLPIVLCDLEGQSRTTAARQLGWPPGTVAGRLARGRQLLANRLTKRGVAFSASVVTTALASNAASASVPAASSQLAAKAAALAATGQLAGSNVVSAKILGLTQGVLKTMLFSKLKTATAMLFISFSLVSGVVLAVQSAGEAPSEQAGKEPMKQGDAPKAASGDVKKPAPGDPVEPKPDTIAVSRPIRSISGHTDRLVAAAFSPDGKSIATAAWDGTTRIWDAATGKETLRLDFPATKGYNTFHQIAFTPDNSRLVTSVRESRDASAVVVWDLSAGKRLHEFPAEAGGMALSPDGTLVACGGYRLIQLYDLATGKLVREMRDVEEKQLRVDSLTFTPDGKSLVSTGHPPTPQPGNGRERLTIMPDVVRVWDVATGKERPSPLNGAVVGRLGPRIKISPDGRTLVHPNNKDVSLREIATGAERAKLKGHVNDVCEFAFTPDGRTLASTAMDGTVRLWDIPSGKEIIRLGDLVDSFKGGWILAVAFSPDLRLLVSGGLDKKADIWDVSRFIDRPRTSVERAPAQLEADWKDLAGEPTAGYAAIGRLVASAEQSIPYLAKQLQAAETPDLKRIEQLIGELDAEQFAVREKARQDLEALDDLPGPSLEKALASNRSLETQRRLTALLDRIATASLSAKTLRQIRAVEALELIGNPDAQRLLIALAASPHDMRLTREATASVKRLAKVAP